MLTNREIATATILVAVLAWALTSSQTRKSLNGVIHALLKRPVVTVVLLYFTYSSAIIYLAYILGAWNAALLKDTLLIVLTVGIPMVVNATSTKDGGLLMRQAIRSTLGFSTVLIFYVNLSSLSIFGEIVVQIVASLAVMLSVVAKHQPNKNVVVARIMDVIIAIIGLALLGVTTTNLVNAWPNQEELVSLAYTFGLSIWLPLTLLPFIYILAFYAACESLLVVLPFFNERKKPPRKVRVAIIFGFRGSVRYASNFSGYWRGAVATQSSYRSTRRLMNDYRTSVRVDAAARNAALKRLRDYAGVRGVEEHGRQLDQREFDATKQFLEDLAMFQMGQHRNRLNHYNPDILGIMGSGDRYQLPHEHGVTMVLSDDKQNWYAWRTTISGWVLGVGGTSNIDRRWVYEASQPPQGFPDQAADWVTMDDLSTAPDWDPEPATDFT